MKVMDRYLAANFIAAYLICFTSLVGLYMTIDLFSKADEFIEDHPITIVFLRRAAKYYWVHGFEYFDKLSPIITQIAAMTTLASLHRHNEIVALLAAGIPTRRALVPILAASVAVIGLAVLNREIVLPRHCEQLQRLHEDIEGNLALNPTMRMDREQVLIQARSAHRQDQRLEGVNITFPIKLVGQFPEIRCPNAYWEHEPASGRPGWRLVDPSPADVAAKTDKVIRLTDGSLFLFSDVTFSDMIRRNTWIHYASTRELVEQLDRPGTKNPEDIRIRVHFRLLQPALSLLLVLIGIPFVLQWEQRNVYRSIAVSMVLSGVFFVVGQIAALFASAGYIEPLTAAWLPVLLFGPLCVLLFQRMGT